MNVIPRKILIADDDPAMRRILVKILQNANYEVLAAADGREALDLMRSECARFVVTDWDMPVLNGVELCQALRRNEDSHYVYIVMLTGSYKDSLVEGLGCGADDFITKPVDSRELLARLQAGSRIVDLESRLRELVKCDSLTGVLNRRTFFEILDKEWHRSTRSAEPMSCIIMDVDHFKSVNDTFGHQAGDRVLQDIARALQYHCRVPDHVCRYGGEEFCILLPNTAAADAMQCAERCRRAIEALTFDGSIGGRRVTASFGVAERDGLSANPAQLVNVADQALLVSKRLGRNRTTSHCMAAQADSALLTV
jgi:diguanylate cyclase (GGDEF)-like protein